MNLNWNYLSVLLKTTAIIIIFGIIGYFIANFLRSFIRKIFIKDIFKKEIVTFVSDVIFYLVFLGSIIVGFKVVGVDVNAILAGLGLGSFILGLALKDIISSFVNGIFILSTKTFQIGDFVQIGDKKGTVKSINLRYTVLIDDSNNKTIILIPNSLVSNSVFVISKKQ
ncbi:MAG: mechanosensitive ion channel family protein [Minisyncoccia bacterium]